MPSTSQRSIRSALVLVSVLVVAYSLLIVQEVLFGFVVVVLLWLVYLFARLVSVLERIASALETRATSGREPRSPVGESQQPSETYRHESDESERYETGGREE